MKADRYRRPGFYWVRFEGALCVAEYVKTCGSCPGPGRGHWHFPGVESPFIDIEICELLSGRIEPPKHV